MRIILIWAACLVAASLPGCDRSPEGPGSKEAGFLALRLDFGTPASMLLKKSSLDTLFRIDSIKIILTAEGAPPESFSYPFQGRADTGAMSFAVPAIPLPPLRAWNVRVISLDEQNAPAREDTVHSDSFTVPIKPGDTASVTRILPARFSILRVRLLSGNPDSLPKGVLFARLRVDGKTRDSISLGRGLNGAAFGNANNGYLVGDSGTVFRTSNGGLSWEPSDISTRANLNAVSFPGANVGYAVGDSGFIAKTTDGVHWARQVSGTASALRGADFSGNNAGCAVGDEGTILRLAGGAWNRAVSPAGAAGLKAVCFPKASIGFAAGDGGTVLKSIDGGSHWSTLALGTSADLFAVDFPSATVGYAAGDSGLILKTTDGGATWARQQTGTASALRAIRFLDARTGWASGDGGMLLKTVDGAGWTRIATANIAPLRCLGFSSTGKSGVAGGAEGACLNYSGTSSSWREERLGVKTFEVLLAEKHLQAGMPHTIILGAIDTLRGALRGYQASLVFTPGPGVDTLLSPNLTLGKCGYAGFNACIP